MIRKTASLLLFGSSLFAAEFRTGQAARAVFGQPSFSAREAGVSATSLVVAGERLYAADRTQHTYTYDLSALGAASDDRSAIQANGCAVCFVSPIAQVSHSVMPGVAAVSVWGKTVAVADTMRHRVLIWRDATVPKLDRGPDVILSDETGANTLSEPVSVALDGRHLFVGDAALHRVLVWNSLPVSSGQPADEVLGQVDAVSSALAGTPAADSVGVPAALISNGVDLFVADQAANRILVFSPADAGFSRAGVLNAASLNAGVVAPGMLLSVTGKSFTSETAAVDEQQDKPLPRQLGGVEVVLDGVALPLVSVSPEELQAVVPADMADRSSVSFYVRSTRAGAVESTNPVALKMAAANPGIFASGDVEPRAGLLLHGAESSPVTEEYPARAGEELTVWATGLGAVLDDGTVAVPVTAQIDGQAVSVLSARLAEHTAGVYEVRIVLPSPERSAATAQLVIAQNNSVSNAVRFAFTSQR